MNQLVETDTATGLSVRHIKTILCVLPAAALTTLADAAVFECIDQAGRTVYRDAECVAGEVFNQAIALEALEAKTNLSEPHLDNSGPLGRNLLKNPSFENRLIDWRVPLGAMWSANQGVSNSGGLVIQAEIPPDDEYIHETTVEQCVPLGPGEKFQLTGKFKAEKILTGKHAEHANVANRANVIWYESIDCASGGQYGWYIEPENMPGWQALSSSHLKPAFQAKAAKITIVQRGRYARGNKGYWDDIALFASEVHERSETTPARPDPKHTRPLNQNYVRNPAFRRNLDDWRGWRATWSAQGDLTPGSAKVTYTSENGGMGAAALSQCVNIGENTRFDFGASVRIDPRSTQKGGGRIRVSWNDKENCSGRSKSDRHTADVKDVSGWQTLKVPALVAPHGAHSAHLELIQSIRDSGRFSIYWDDVYFKAVAVSLE